jgi:hypothetical protein
MPYQNDAIVIALWIGLGFLFWCVLSWRIFGGRIMRVVLVAAFLTVGASRSSAEDRYVEVKMNGVSGWFNPLGATRGGTNAGVFYSYPAGQTQSWALGGIQAFDYTTQRFYLTKYEGEGAIAEYYLCYADLYKGADATSAVAHRIGFLVYSDSVTKKIALKIKTDEGLWREVFQGSSFPGTLNLVVFDRNSATSNASIPEVQGADPTGVEKGFIACHGTEFSGATTQPTTDTFEEPEPATQPDVASTPASMPTSRESTTQPWVIDTVKHLVGLEPLGEQARPTVLSEARRCVTATGGAPDGVLYQIPTFEESSTWEQALENFKVVSQAIFPGAFSATIPGETASLIFDGSPEYLVGLALKGFEDARNAYDAPLSFFRGITETFLWVWLAYYAAMRLAWALGIRAPEEMMPPLPGATGVESDERATTGLM